jgi:tRNA modification GTPase
MIIDDTIAAISTPVGHGGIGIVRLSGKDAIHIADRIFVSSRKQPLKKTPSRKMSYGHIVNSKNEIIDEVLVSVMKSPHTYTKEDVVEINSHGGPIPLRRILELVLNSGARLAEPGEFTQRAFFNGRIDLTQAEAVLDIINALTEQGQKAALEQLSGGLSKKLESIRQELIKLTAFIEAYIDFPDEDISPPSLKNMRKSVSGVQHSLKELIHSSQYGMILRDGLKTAIVGRPNVGKSSLLNALLDHDRAIVTEIPGTTRDVIEDYLNIQGIPVKIMDTAGIREVKNIAEKEGVKRSLRAMKDADLVLIVLDGSIKLNDTDRELMDKSGLLSHEQPLSNNTILVINKSDLPQKISLKKYSSSVQVSALRRSGINILKKMIAEKAVNGGPVCRTGIVTNIRHVQALKKTLGSVDSFVNGVEGNLSPELLAVELRDALDAIGEIIGITTPEEILNTIFKNFCIGK